ncbi:MAG: recombinase RecT [Flavobacteriales bacterium]|nr:recombinase RecT [Flavobacteriales bacterium]
MLDLDRRSLYSSVLKAAEVGLELNSMLGHAYLVPYKSTITFIPGYKGLMDLARRGGDIQSFSVQEVRENDEFYVDFGKEGLPFSHRPRLTGERGEATFFWCLARFKDGSFHWDFMGVEDIKKIQNGSASARSSYSPWKTHFVEMAKKTIVRRVCKMLPVSAQRLVEKAVEMENSIDNEVSSESYNEDVFDGCIDEDNIGISIDDQEKKEIKMQEILENASTLDELKSEWEKAKIECPNLYKEWNDIKEKRKLELIALDV